MSETVASRDLRSDTAGLLRRVESGERVTITVNGRRVHLAETGRRCTVNDLWIAATAASRGWAVVTQDDDFGPVEGVGGLRVVRV